MTFAPPEGPPPDVDTLRARAHDIAGLSLGELAHALGVAAPVVGLHAKGKAGTLVERALGATAGSAAVPDFPHLGVELKTIPVDAAGAPLESTFVCTISLADADRAEWSTSRVRAKLAHVLWVPLVAPDRDEGERRIGAPVLWRPTAEQEAVLNADFDDLMGEIGLGRIEAITAHAGRWLQVRPKAATGRVRTLAFGREGERLATIPRGFYLRPSFTGALLRDPAALP